MSHDVSPGSSYSFAESEHASGGVARPPKRRAVDTGDGQRRIERCLQACNRCKEKKLKCRKAQDNPSVCISCAKADKACVVEVNGLGTRGGLRYVAALEERIADLEQALAARDPLHPSVADHASLAVADVAVAADALPDDLFARAADNPFAFLEPGQDGVVDAILPPPLQAAPTLSPLAIAASASIGHFGLQRLIQTSARAPRHPVDPTAVIQPRSATPVVVQPNPALPPAHLAERIIRTLYRHVQARYPFMDWDELRRWHDRREQLCADPATRDDQIGAFFIWAVYAAGVETAREPGLESPETYFEQASKYLDAVLVAHDLVTVRAVLLVVFYAFRSRSGPPLWLVNGFVMQLCVQLGLHQKPSTDLLDAEIRKRLFWSAYSFDRVICFASDRPFSIGDNSIDVGLPVDIDCDVTDPAAIANAARHPTGQPTTMTLAIHQIRLYRIRSRLRDTFYAVGAPAPTEEATRAFLTELSDWRQGIPRDLPADYPAQPYDKMYMAYLQTVLYTLRPSLVAAGQKDARLALCASAAAEACELSKSVIRERASEPPILGVYHIFSCGLTLLYCLSIAPAVVPARTAFRAVRSCSSTLNMYSQMFPAVHIFCDLFDEVADEVQDTGERAADDPLKGPLTAAMGRVLMGAYEQLAVLQKLVGSKSRDASAAAFGSVYPAAAPAPAALPPAAATATAPAASAPDLAFTAPFLGGFPLARTQSLAPTPGADIFQDLADLSAYVDFPLDSELGWQTAWAQT